MSMHLQREMINLRKKILGLGAVVENAVGQSVRALEARDTVLAEKICDADEEVDAAEIEVEEECLKILALHQPVAVDLRFIVSILKINNDLERIGDLSVNIANKARRLAEEPELPITLDFDSMSATVRRMLNGALDALINFDNELAEWVRGSDDHVDEMKAQIQGRVLDLLRREPERVEALQAVLGAARNLERIADLATNIAEDVIYMTDGEIVRHQPSETTPAG
jgi:phosphate transport system protein